jgi:hypothetical protein
MSLLQAVIGRGSSPDPEVYIWVREPRENSAAGISYTKVSSVKGNIRNTRSHTPSSPPFPTLDIDPRPQMPTLVRPAPRFPAIFSICTALPFAVAVSPFPAVAFSISKAFRASSQWSSKLEVTVTGVLGVCLTGELLLDRGMIRDGGVAVGKWARRSLRLVSINR